MCRVRVGGSPHSRRLESRSLVVSNPIINLGCPGMYLGGAGGIRPP